MVLEKKSLISLRELTVHLHCKYQVTVPTKRQEELVWFQRQTSAVQAVGFVPKTARRRRSARRT